MILDLHVPVQSGPAYKHILEKSEYSICLFYKESECSNKHMCLRDGAKKKLVPLRSVVYPSPQRQRPEKTNFAHPPPRVTGIN